MKHVLKKGVVEILLPDNSGGGLTGETHLITYDGQKYVLKKCKDLARAKYYEHLSAKFESYGFLPKMLGRFGKNVLYEYIEGRDLRSKRERLENIRQVGSILSRINSFKSNDNFVNSVNVFLDELESGRYKSLGKVVLAREKRGLKVSQRKVLSGERRRDIARAIDDLWEELKPDIVYECTDPTSGNFRVRDGRVYLVDIESIKLRYKGFGISKFFLQWAKTRGQRQKFIEGYGEESLRFFTPRYKSFTDLNFLVQRLWFEVQTDKDYRVPLKKIDRLVKNLNSHSS